MNTQQKTEITSLRSQGFGYAKIAQALGLSKNTVKSYCRRNNLPSAVLEDPSGITPSFCLECGTAITQAAGRKTKNFCSDACRHKWWNARPEEITRKALYAYSCAGCGKAFSAYGNSHRKYCCHACYIAARFKGGDRDE